MSCDLQNETNESWDTRKFNNNPAGYERSWMYATLLQQIASSFL